jgi:hypothetical protein
MGREDEEREHSKKRKYSHEGEKEGKRLPFNARTLTKNYMEEFKGVFTRYLKEKKDIHIDDISSTEAYARFKSFVHKW